MKRKLLFAVMTLITGAWALSASAQKDVTSQYITNATLSSLNGWTTNNFNTPVKGNNTKGYASEAYAGWGSLEKTAYSLKQSITLPAGHYTLVNYSFFRQGANATSNPTKSLAYLVAGSKQVALKTLGSITATGYANSQAEGANCFDSKMYRNTLDFEITADGTTIEIGLQGTFDEMRSWCIAGMFELINNDIPATMDAPFDVTGYITNPGFEYRDMSGWTLSPADYFGTQNNNQDFKVGGYYAQKWQSSASGALSEGSMTQTLTSLPAGFYKLIVNLGGNGAYVSLNGKTANWTADADYTVGYVLSENEDLTITAGKTAEGTANWIHFDNFRLQYCGDVAAALTTLLSQVSQYEGRIPAAAYTQLQSDVAAYDHDYSDVDELLAAIDAVQALLDAADLLLEPYQEWLVLKPYADALMAVPNDNADANSTLSTSVSSIAANAEAALIAATIQKATADLKTAMTTYAGVANPTDETKPFDLTFMLTNPDVTSYWDGTWYIRPEGWYNDQEGGNFQVMANEAMGPGGEVFMEYYYDSPRTSGFVLYQKVNLTPGTYKMTGRVGLQQAVNGTTANMTFSANETDGSQIPVGALSDQEVEFVNSAEQEVKIGIKAQEGNCYRWIGINKIRMYKYPTVDTDFNIVTDATNCSLTVTVNDVEATTAKKLDPVKFTVALEENYAVESATVTYFDGTDTQTITPTNLGSNVYTFQMPAYDVTITVVASVDKSALQAAIASAETVDVTTTQAPAAILTAFTDALASAQTVNASATATYAEVSDAAAALTAAQTELNAAVEAYEAYLELKPYADALVAAPTDNTEAQGTLNTAITTAATDIEAATDATTAADVNTALRTAMDTYAAAANPTDETKPFNLTYMLVNPNLEGLPTRKPCAGWYTDQPDGNSQVMTNDAATSEDGTKTAFYEYWSYTAKSNNLFTLYQPVTLPEGTYSMSCYAFAKQQDDPDNTGDKVGVYFYANDTQGSAVSTDRLSAKTIEFVNATEQEVKIGLKAISPNSYNWMGIGYLELYKIPAATITLDPENPMIAEGTEGYEVDFKGYDYKLEKAGDVTLRRPIKEGLNTLVLPFSMTQAEVETTFGEGSKISILKEYNSETESLHFTRQEGVVANRPCLLKATQAIAEGTDILIEGRTLVACESGLPSYAVTGATMYGTYAAQTTVPVNSWYVQNSELVYAEEGAPQESWVKMTRAYITLKDWTPDASGAKSLNIFFDDEEATGIATLENGKLNIRTGKAYDLSGREVKNPTKGLYIIDGKKVFLK